MHQKKELQINKEKEQFRRIGNQLKGYKEQGKNCIAFTSTSIEQGKTYIINKMAKMLAKGGHKVLMVDANMLDSTLTQMYGMTDQEGIGGVIEKLENQQTKQIAEEGYIKEIGPNLYLLPSGYRDRVEEMIMNKEESIKEMFVYLGTQFDYVLVEVPSFEGLSLTQILTKALEGCILVIKSGQLEKAEVSQTMGVIETLGCEVMCCILNKKEDIVYKIPKQRNVKRHQRKFFKRAKTNSIGIGEELAL